MFWSVGLSSVWLEMRQPNTNCAAGKKGEAGDTAGGWTARHAVAPRRGLRRCRTEKEDRGAGGKERERKGEGCCDRDGCGNGEEGQREERDGEWEGRPWRRVECGWKRKGPERMATRREWGSRRPAGKGCVEGNAGRSESEAGGRRRCWEEGWGSRGEAQGRCHIW